MKKFSTIACNLNSFISLLFALLVPSLVVSQDLSVLNEKNGFREYKLGKNISTYPNVEIIQAGIRNVPLVRKNNSRYKDQLYSVNIKDSKLDENLFQGQIYLLHLYTYNDLIYRIEIDIENGHMVYDNLVLALGNPTDTDNISQNEKYSWNAGDVSLYCTKNNNLTILNFIDNKIYNALQDYLQANEL